MFDEKNDAFLEKVKQLAEMDSSIQDIEKAVVLFTAAVEIGSEEIGFTNMLDVLNQLKAIVSNKNSPLWDIDNNITLH